MLLLVLRRLYNTFVPVDEAGAEYFKSLEPNQEIIVSVKKATKTELRRSAQNRLYWAWITNMSKATVNEYAGWSKEDWHFEMKKRFLVPIFERDEPEYALTIETLRTVYRTGMKQESERLHKYVVKETSTTQASVQQFSEYLTEIQRFCGMAGIWLRTDEALMQMAIDYDREEKQ